MDPITALLIGLTIALGTAAVVAILHYEDILKWFHERNKIKQRDKDNIAFTLKEKMKSGQYTVIQGIFNKRTEKLIDGQKVTAKELDSDLKKTMGRKKLAIYT